MNKLKFFDRYQLIIAIVALSAFVLFLILYTIAFLTATATYKEPGVIDEIHYNPVLLGLFSSFFFVHLLAVIWFIIRAITFKMREKEYDAQ